MSARTLQIPLERFKAGQELDCEVFLFLPLNQRRFRIAVPGHQLDPLTLQRFLAKGYTHLEVSWDPEKGSDPLHYPLYAASSEEHSPNTSSPEEILAVSTSSQPEGETPVKGSNAEAEGEILVKGTKAESEGEILLKGSPEEGEAETLVKAGQAEEEGSILVKAGGASTEEIQKLSGPESEREGEQAFSGNQERTSKQRIEGDSEAQSTQERRFRPGNTEGDQLTVVGSEAGGPEQVQTLSATPTLRDESELRFSSSRADEDNASPISRFAEQLESFDSLFSGPVSPEVREEVQAQSQAAAIEAALLERILALSSRLPGAAPTQESMLSDEILELGDWLPRAAEGSPLPESWNLELPEEILNIPQLLGSNPKASELSAVKGKINELAQKRKKIESILKKVHVQADAKAAKAEKMASAASTPRSPTKASSRENPDRERTSASSRKPAGFRALKEGITALTAESQGATAPPRPEQKKAALLQEAKSALVVAKVSARIVDVAAKAEVAKGPEKEIAERDLKRLEQILIKAESGQTLPPAIFKAFPVDKELEEIEVVIKSGQPAATKEVVRKIEALEQAQAAARAELDKRTENSASIVELDKARRFSADEKKEDAPLRLSASDLAPKESVATKLQKQLENAKESLIKGQPVTLEKEALLEQAKAAIVSTKIVKRITSLEQEVTGSAESDPNKEQEIIELRAALAKADAGEPVAAKTLSSLPKSKEEEKLERIFTTNDEAEDVMELSELVANQVKERNQWEQTSTEKAQVTPRDAAAEIERDIRATVCKLAAYLAHSLGYTDEFYLENLAISAMARFEQKRGKPIPSEILPPFAREVLANKTTHDSVVEDSREIMDFLEIYFSVPDCDPTLKDLSKRTFQKTVQSLRNAPFGVNPWNVGKWSAFVDRGPSMSAHTLCTKVSAKAFKFARSNFN